MLGAATELGLTGYRFGTRIEGEASTVGQLLATLAVETAVGNEPFRAPSALLGAGGEVVVTMSARGPTSAVGDPHLEAALAFACALAHHDSSAAFSDLDDLIVTRPRAPTSATSGRSSSIPP